MMIRRAESRVMPELKVRIQHDIQLHMQMRPPLIDPAARVTHPRHHLTQRDLGSSGDECFFQMRIQRVKRPLTPIMFNDEIAAVITLS